VTHLKNISLKRYNTFGLDYRSAVFISIKSEDEAISVLRKAGSIKKPLFVLGAGSNILFTKDYSGTIIHPEIEFIKIEEQKSDYVVISSGAGVIWDKLVEWAVNKGFGGIENLSMIPGMVGATPVQNIGAYGVEAKEIIEKVRAISTKDGAIHEFNNKECRFGYRDSIFKRELKGKFLITEVWYRLKTDHSVNTAYGSLREEAEKLGSVSIKTVREAVTNIRKNKLPDPAEIGNGGSFFKNPVLTVSIAEDLKEQYPHMPVYNDPSGGKKIAAGWLIEQCGWKGKRTGDAGVHNKQSLVLVNYGNTSGSEILRLSEDIKQSVFDKFRIELEREVEVL
jgi:UDP-N-acetylmuramate dehydrogenase